ncbi:hypothetical protein SePPVgORF108 [Seal parapoxvirus]|uniref:Uncharacterized protein n=1 Tax=Seal parapoxvirus TaxID=187984 RepID=A0A1Z3GCP6_9POXV|nr:hypothetical protein CGV03_gp108 [Seal parapoxvirus]ASC55530.1 hypothetical protein SePPVgORF108 [Seal parapoxvirus]
MAALLGVFALAVLAMQPVAEPSPTGLTTAAALPSAPAAPNYVGEPDADFQKKMHLTVPVAAMALATVVALAIVVVALVKQGVCNCRRVCDHCRRVCDHCRRVCSSSCAEGSRDEEVADAMLYNFPSLDSSALIKNNTLGIAEC